MRALARNLWRRLPPVRARYGLAIVCNHTVTRTRCQLRLRPGDTRKSCWEVCQVTAGGCGKYLACSNC